MSRLKVDATYVVSMLFALPIITTKGNGNSVFELVSTFELSSRLGKNLNNSLPPPPTPFLSFFNIEVRFGMGDKYPQMFRV